MDEEPNYNELEDRLYAMLHHVDETQPNLNTSTYNDATNILDNAPKSTVRRYWRTSVEQNNTYQKVNAPKDNTTPPVSKKTPLELNIDETKPKEEKSEIPTPSVDHTLFQSAPKIVTKTIEVIDHEPQNSVLLDSSDEDEVIEVALPPKPTITIESSDEDDIRIISKEDSPSKVVIKPINVPENITPASNDREVSASPVPSVVSSVSDEFIRGDCIALNISSRHPDDHSFDFSLHGSDLLGQETPSKRKKKKKAKEVLTSSPMTTASSVNTSTIETCFATPKSKAKNKKQKNKSYTVGEKSVPNADIYDSDSNQSVIETNKDPKTIAVTSNNSDVYESDSSEIEPINKTQPTGAQICVESCISSSEISFDLETPIEMDTNSKHTNDSQIVDLTGTDEFINLDDSDITETIVMGNVTGFKESEDYGVETDVTGDAPMLGSTKVPKILFEDLDFDNLNGKEENVCKRRRYSLTTLRAEMEKFYNDSWGGEDFNHREIQKYMSRDKSLWMIDPKDRMPALSKRKKVCNYCNRPGHRDETCRVKPPVCYMCGSTGHYEPRCPSKICVNCGSPNNMYSTMCRNCSWWPRAQCAECGQRGHPHSHCPDLWRRYHNTIDENMPLVENRQMKKSHQQFCSCCTRRGHLAHACRSSLPFSGLPLHSPYVSLYRPVYRPTHIPSPYTDKPDSNKRLSKSPMHENHLNKKRNLSTNEDGDNNERRASNDFRQRKNSQSKNQDLNNKTNRSASDPQRAHLDSEKAPDYIPISSSNHDKKGHIIQDNEVSDTSDAITSARVYITNEVVNKLKSEEGEAWLKRVTQKYSLDVNLIDQATAVKAFLNITGKYPDQEDFQAELRAWSEGYNKTSNEPLENNAGNIPINRCNLLRTLGKALDSLKVKIGDPVAIYKEVNYLQNHHEQLLRQKVISHKKVSNSRQNLNQMLKKLNMVLLGQAGLANGSKHVQELYFLRSKVQSIKSKNISIEMRKRVGQHYHQIFSSHPRNDYEELLNLYYVKINPSKSMDFLNKKKNKPRKKKMENAPSPDKETYQGNSHRASLEKENTEKDYSLIDNTTNKMSNVLQPVSLGKLYFYHNRIRSSHPTGGVLKKTKIELIRKLHANIMTLRKRPHDALPSKMQKKIRKIQRDAITYLSNV